MYPLYYYYMGFISTLTKTPSADGGNLPEESVLLISKLSNLHSLSVQYCDEFSELESLSNLR